MIFLLQCGRHNEHADGEQECYMVSLSSVVSLYCLCTAFSFSSWWNCESWVVAIMNLWVGNSLFDIQLSKGAPTHKLERIITVYVCPASTGCLCASRSGRFLKAVWRYWASLARCISHCCQLSVLCHFELRTPFLIAAFSPKSTPTLKSHLEFMS